jgi:hypothetical protein
MVGILRGKAVVFVRLSSLPGPVPSSFADRFRILAEVRWIGKHDGPCIFQGQAVLRDRPQRVPFLVHKLTVEDRMSPVGTTMTDMATALSQKLACLIQGCSPVLSP